MLGVQLIEENNYKLKCLELILDFLFVYLYNYSVGGIVMYHIITNPISGRKKNSYKKLKAVFDYLDANKIDYKLYESQYYRHPVELAKQITSENESGDLIVIGGDGTFNEVLNGVVDFSKWNIGLIPSGSGNDFAGILGLSKKTPVESLKRILQRNVKPVDYIKVNDMVCVNVLGTGIDVDVLTNFERHKKLKGSFRYFYSLLESLCHIKWYEFDVSIDDGPFEHKKGLIVALCNGRNIGGGIPVCPMACPSDNMLNFVYISQVKKITILGKLMQLMSGKIAKIKEAQIVSCKKAVFRDKENLVLQIDGNVTGDYNEYRCEIVENGINMYR